MSKSFELSKFEVRDLMAPLIQIFRDGKPLSEERLNVYWNTLKKFNHDIIKRCVEIIIEEKPDQRYFPKPAEIIEMTHRAFQTRPASDSSILQYIDGKEECPKCYDTGRVLKEVARPELHKATYTTAYFCSCEMGERMMENWRLHMRGRSNVRS